MGILINEQTRVLVQGITGREARSVSKEMIDYGTKVVAGVTPGKGGQEVHGVPVYDTLSQALADHPEVNTVLTYVPPLSVKDAVFEAIEAGIPLINIVTERVPMLDAAQIHEFARARRVRIVGPTSVGIINPSARVKVGAIGGSNVDRVYRPGRIGVISKSGGMTTETSWIIRQAGFGISTAMGIGGDFIKGGNFVDLVPLFFADEQTDAIVIFGEPGGGDEEALAEYVMAHGLQKPIVAFISGRFVDRMPQGVQFGHAGAVVERGMGSPAAKIAALRRAGIPVAEVHAQIADLLKEVLS